jgi:hypothetical protein
VPQLDIDAALNDLGLDDRRVNILKIDVEGYEPDVIAGASRTLERTDVVIHEFSPELSRAGGLSADDLLAGLDAAGFLPFTFGPACGLVQMDLEELGEFQGQSDLVWIKETSSVPSTQRAYAAAKPVRP